MIEYIYYIIINELQCLELGPHGELCKSTGAFPTPEEESPHGVQTPVAVAAADDQMSPRLRQEPGGDGEVEGCTLDSMDKLHRERIVFKGTDHVMQLIVSGSANHPDPQRSLINLTPSDRPTRDEGKGRAILAGGKWVVYTTNNPCAGIGLA